MTVKFHADSGSYILSKYKESLCNWLQRNGIDPNFVSEVTVQGKKIKVIEMLTDASGRYVLNKREDNLVTKVRSYPLKEAVPAIPQAEYDKMIGRKWKK